MYGQVQERVLLAIKEAGEKGLLLLSNTQQGEREENQHKASGILVVYQQQQQHTDNINNYINNVTIKESDLSSLIHNFITILIG